MITTVIALLTVLLFQIAFCQDARREYSEHLTLNAFGQGYVLADFKFTQSIPFPLGRNERNLGTFPKQIYEVFHEYNQLKTIRLTMTRTRWRQEKWGTPEWPLAPIGVQVSATFNQSQSSAYGGPEETWDRLVMSLSGIFCAGLNLLDSTRTHRLPSADPNLISMHGMLPKETVCTENLTPFVKLLPCGNAAGLGTLLNPTRIFDADYALLTFEAEVKCEQSVCTLQIVNNVHVLFDRLQESGSCDWTVEGLFKRSFTKTCSDAVPNIIVKKQDSGKFIASLESKSENKNMLSINGTKKPYMTNSTRRHSKSRQDRGRVQGNGSGKGLFRREPVTNQCTVDGCRPGEDHLGFDGQKCQSRPGHKSEPSD